MECPYGMENPFAQVNHSIVAVFRHSLPSHSFGEARRKPSVCLDNENSESDT